jgi:hypothetical protein
VELHSDKPVRNRQLITTLELCLNTKAGPYGAIEAIISRRGAVHPDFYYWNVDNEGRLDANQLRDVQVVIERELASALLMKINANQETLRGLGA